MRSLEAGSSIAYTDSETLRHIILIVFNGTCRDQLKKLQLIHLGLYFLLSEERLMPVWARFETPGSVLDRI